MPPSGRGNCIHRILKGHQLDWKQQGTVTSIDTALENSHSFGGVLEHWRALWNISRFLKYKLQPPLSTVVQKQANCEYVRAGS
jgi:hypothetical protein